MNLREEIIDEIDMATREKSVSPSNYKQLADEILKLIEKRIDSRIKDIKDHPFAECDEVIYELEETKKEMLK